MKVEELSLVSSNGNKLPCYIKPIAHWTDNSLKWVLADFQADVEAMNTPQINLISHANGGDISGHIAGLDKVEVSGSGDSVRVDTGAAVFELDKTNPGVLRQVSIDGVDHLGSEGCQLQLLDKQGYQPGSIIKSVDYGEEGNFLKRKITLSGSFSDNSGEVLTDFELVMVFYAGKATVKCSFCLLNPHAAKHPKGVWDLGDEGSFLFRSLVLKIPVATGNSDIQTEVNLSPETEIRKMANAPVKLYQDSSGGENWSSLNHLNGEERMPLSFKGYRFYVNGKLDTEGDRANPVFHVISDQVTVSVYIPDFWQNFPKCLEVDKNELLVKLFPDEFSDRYELQGGEQKTHHFYLDFSSSKSALDWCTQPLEFRLPTTVYAESKAIPWLNSTSPENGIQQLIRRGVKGSKNFFEKREIIDEYGWRNYGEIYADHEQYEYKGSDQLISHYNNQYDALNGLIRQFMLTGDDNWRDLFTAQAQHIIDIDIYNTEEDRDEYNGGLFWHTHHYLNAFTCTHRTFSAKHAKDFIYGEIGGGPGDEHCYTTGLAYFYFLTGEDCYKQAVLKLAHWMIRLKEGSGTVLERIFQFKSRDFILIKRLLSGETIQKNKYPFTRGTGNYITALIDAYQLTGDKSYLSRVDAIIIDTIHPKDSIELRNLADIESSWSYLIFLQALCKYLELKAIENILDDMYYYARDSLLHYSDWIAQHETPFLKRSDVLEFPNHTWVAQDLRKANILYVASCYDQGKKDAYINRARYFTRYVTKELEAEETSYYSRILIILMQNHIDESSLEDRWNTDIKQPISEQSYSLPSYYSVGGIFLDLLGDLFKCLRNLSISQEKRWLNFRLKS